MVIDMARRRLYSGHKYLSAKISEFSRFVARIDFVRDDQVCDVQRRLAKIKDVMQWHAKYENEKIHALLKEKGSALCAVIEGHHAQQPVLFETLENCLAQALASGEALVKRRCGADFYLHVQRFEGENTLHQYEEETVLMPELWRLCSDEEILMQVDGGIYAQMAATDLVAMMKELFPYLNVYDKQGTLNDIYQAAPDRFAAAWEGIREVLTAEERDYLEAVFRGHGR